MLSDFGETCLDFQLSRTLRYCSVLRRGAIARTARMSTVLELRVLKIWGCLRVWSFEFSIVSIASDRPEDLTLRIGLEVQGLGLKFRVPPTLKNRALPCGARSFLQQYRFESGLDVGLYRV